MKIMPCEKDRINEFFQSESNLAEVELAQHLESCASCREYFDARAAPPNRWREATQLLQPTAYDQASTAEFSAGALGQRAPHQPLMIQAVLDHLAPSDDPHRLGRLGGYEISGVIGVGGMGVVLKAHDPALDRVVAIKVMAPHLANNGSSRKRFTREARAAAAVLHPNVIPIHSVSSDAALPYLVMAYIRGGSLQKRLQQQGPFTTVECLRIGSQIAAGLAAAHEQGLVHRDIKPENILLDDGVERVTLTDFGLARAVDDASVTRDGTIAGTPQYMSPEQTLGKPVDQQSDLFSLGSVLYTLCTGTPPFRADSSYAVMRKISDEAPLPIRELNPEIPAWLCAIIGKLMEKNKIHRYKTAREVHELLEACLAHAQQPTVFQLPAQLRDGNDSASRFLKLATESPRWLTVSAALAIFLGLGIYAAFFAPPPANQAANENPGEGEALGFGYTRKGDYIYYDGQRIDQAGKEDLDKFARAVGVKLKLAQDVHAASFKVLSEEYTKDKHKVYYKWISPGRFWVVELPQAEPISFEVIGFNLAKDNKNVWWYGKPMPGVDPRTVEVVNDGFVWKDAKHVWYQREKIVGADPQTFRKLEQAFYSDKNHVYWSGTRLNGANPVLFRTFGDESPYGADLNCVWRASEQIFNVDAPSFMTVHQSVYLDKNGVYAGGNLLDKADPKSFRKLVNLDAFNTALLADAEHYFVYLPYRGEVYRVWLEDKSLKVERRLWALKDPRKPAAGYKSLGIVTAELGAAGWTNLALAADLPPKEIQALQEQELWLLKLHDGLFAKAKEILSEKSNAKKDVPQVAEQPATESAASAKPETPAANSRTPDQKTEQVGILLVDRVGEWSAAGFTVKAAKNDDGTIHNSVQADSSPVFQEERTTTLTETPWFLWIENKDTVWHFDGARLRLLTHVSGRVSHRSVGVEDERVSIRLQPPTFVMQKLPPKLQEKIRGGQEQLKKANAALIHAVLVEDAYAVKKALGDGADPDAVFPGRVNPMTCLEQAAKVGNLKIINLLLDHNANANLRVAEYSPLHSASAYGQLEAIKLLLKRGANPDQQPPVDLQWAHNRSVLDIAVLNRQKEVAQFWVEQGIPITELTWKIATSVAEFDKNNNTTVGQEILEWLKTKGAAKDK